MTDTLSEGVLIFLVGILVGRVVAAITWSLLRKRDAR